MRFRTMNTQPISKIQTLILGSKMGRMEDKKKDIEVRKKGGKGVKIRVHGVIKFQFLVKYMQMRGIWNSGNALA